MNKKGKPGRPGRDQNKVKPIQVRMGSDYIKMFDHICKVNKRSRREIMEMLIEDEARALKADPSTRITP